MLIIDEKELQRVVATCLAEDIGQGDVTSNLLIPLTLMADMDFVARAPMVLAGIDAVAEVYRQLGGQTMVQAKAKAKDGAQLGAGAVLASVSGPARLLLAGERVALNLMQRMSGVATLTRDYVQAVAGTQAIILDTRKTMPGLRLLDKYAVRAGGGQNHRMRLDDMVLIKDNHIALCGSIAAAVAQARAGSNVPVEVECDTLEQVKEALNAMPDRIMLDNMDLAMMREAVLLAEGRVPLEASGNVSLTTVRAIAGTGVQYISVGKLTHSAPAVDIGADITLG